MFVGQHLLNLGVQQPAKTSSAVAAKLWSAQIPRDSSSSAPPCLERMGKSQSKMTEEDFAFVVKHSTLGPGEIKVLSTLSQQTMYHWIQHLIIML